MLNRLITLFRRCRFPLPLVFAKQALAIVVLAGSFVAPPDMARAQLGGAPLLEAHWLARDGRFFGKIYLPENPAPEESEAARELAHWFEKVAGVVPEVVTESAGRLHPGIYLGATRQAAERGIVAPQKLGETWRWEARQGWTLFLLGNSPLATRLAVGEFIQRHLGVLFLMPGEWGAEWTPLRTVPVPRYPHVREPAYLWRTLGMQGNPAQQTWMRHNGLGVRPPFSHALHTVFTKDTFAEHPEFFPVIGGAVRAPSGRGGYEPQPSLAVPGAATYAARAAAAFFEKNPDAPTFALGITDNMTWDESPLTRALAPHGKYFRNKPDYSDYVFTFMNRVATALWPRPTRDWDVARWSDTGAGRPAPASLAGAVSPDKLLGCLAYYHCENVPDFPLHPNVFPVVTADRSQWRDPAFRAEDGELLRRWGRTGARHFGMYDYYYGVDYLIPRIFFAGEIDSIRTGAAAGASMFYAEIFPNWGFDGPKAWLAAQLLQDPGQNAPALLGRFFDQAYGAAAAPMREFYAVAEQCWNEQPGPARWIKFWRMENMGALVSPGQQERMRAALRRAEEAFPSSGSFASVRDAERLQRQQVRVRMTVQAFTVTERFLEWYRLREALLQTNPATPELALQALDRLGRERELRKQFLAALEAWRVSPINPGAAPNWSQYFTGAVDATVGARILHAWKTGDPDGTAPGWREALVATSRWAAQNHLQPLVDSALFPDAVSVLVAESFGRESFRAPRAGGWAEGRDITLLKSPWRTILFENAFVRFGFSGERPRSGEGCLRIAGGEQTTLTRSAPVSPGDWISGAVWCRGRINPGTYTGLEMQFFDAAGKMLGGRNAILHPADYAEWRPLAVAAPAPGGAVRVDVAIRSMSQEADEVFDWDDFSIEKLPAEGK